MSTPQFASVPAAFDRNCVSFIVTNGTQAKVLVDQLPAAAAAGTSPLFAGGGTLVEMSAVNSSGAANTLQLFNCKVLTTVGGATGACATTASAITRTTGSFITDGFRVGDQAMVFAASSDAPNALTDGILVTITNVTALQLTVNGTPFSALAIATGSRICRAALKFVTSLVAQAGALASTDCHDLLHGAIGDSYDDRQEWKLGANSILAAAVGTAVAALPAYVAVDVAYARY